MLGVSTSFEILRLTVDDLVANGDPNGIAAAINKQRAYANLGAIGPGLGDFLTHPFPEEAPFPDDYKTLWRRIFHVIGRKDPPGLYHVLKDLNQVLDTVSTVADAEDCDALVELRDEGIEDRIAQVTQDFADSVATVQAEALIIADLIGTSLKPVVSSGGLLDIVPPPDSWSPRECMSWNRTGAFVSALLEKANSTGDDRLHAYALGYLVSYSAHVCGSGHINSITGGPPRTQWWRQRFVANYVDTWVHGYYNQSPRPTFTGDVPTPAYESGAWPDLCSANLQDEISLGDLDPEELMDLAARGRDLPDIVPDDFAQNWFEAADDAFDDMPEAMTAQALNSAYVFHWLVLWFRTSGAVLPCNSAPPMVPPDGCGESETELDPFVNGVPLDGNIPQPPDPNIDADVDVAAVICGIILAILGGVLILGGNVALGGAAIAGAVALFDCDNVTDLDWKKIRCLLFHERMYLHNALVGIQRLLVVAGLDHPYSKDLAKDEDYADLFPFLEPWETGRNLTRSRQDISYPGEIWDGSLITFNRPPTSFESPQTVAFSHVGYPDGFIDDPAHPLANNGVKSADPTLEWPDGGPFKSISASAAKMPAPFGNAVTNAVDLLNSVGSNELPDWNLDSDRGLASLNWRFLFSYNPDDVNIKPAE